MAKKEQEFRGRLEIGGEILAEDCTLFLNEDVAFPKPSVEFHKFDPASMCMEFSVTIPALFLVCVVTPEVEA